MQPCSRDNKASAIMENIVEKANNSTLNINWPYQHSYCESLTYFP